MPIRSTNFDAASLASLRQAKYVQTNAAHVQAQMKLGKRIVNVKDDASGASIAANLKARNAGENEGVRNLQEASGALGIAENALSNIAEKLNNLKALGVRAATGLKAQEERALIMQEVTEIKAAMAKEIDAAEYNGKRILTGGIADAMVKYGIGSLQFTIDESTLRAFGLGTEGYMCDDGAGNMAAATLTDALDWICMGGPREPDGSINVNPERVYKYALSAGLGVKMAEYLRDKEEYRDRHGRRGVWTDEVTGYIKERHCLNISSSVVGANYTGVTKTKAFIDTVERAISQLSTIRGNLGATQVLVESAIESAESNIDKTDEARSTIEDTDSLEAQVNATTAQSLLNLAARAILATMRDNFKSASIGMRTMRILMGS